jgi:hypothetical protein
MTNRYSKDNIVAVFSLSLICISCLCVWNVGLVGGDQRTREKKKTEDQKTDEGWKKKIEEKEEKISQLTCD